MTVNTHLATLASALVLSADENASIQTSVTTLGSRLNAYFGTAVSSHFRFGSHPRGTMLPRKADPQSDVDYMVVFDTSKDGEKKPQTYLTRLKTFAEKKYASSEIAQSSPTIVLSLQHIRFELVPAVYNYSYKIPAPASSWAEWMFTDPKSTDSALQDKNKQENYQIKPLVRLIKYWNARKGHLYWSFELEKYIVERSYFSCSSIGDYFYAFWTGFSPSYSAPQHVKDHVEAAKKHASKASEYERAGMPANAEAEIKMIVPAL